jgi:hypothetical protein
LLFDRDWLAARLLPAINPARKVIVKNLIAETDLFIGMDANAFVALPIGTRFSIWHNALMELWLRFRIRQERSSLEHATDLALAFGDQPKMGLDLFPTEMERGTILTALGLFYDLARDDTSESQQAEIRAIIYFHATELWRKARQESWGCSERAEIWNHTVIAYAGIGIAGLVLRKHHAEASEWIRVATEKACGYLKRGLTARGANREGTFYAGLSMKCLAPFVRATLRTAPKRETAELRILAEQRAPAYLSWLFAETVPSGGQINNANDAVLDPHLAVNGLLIFAADCDPKFLFRVWNRLVGKDGARTFGKDRFIRYSSLFEACLFLPDFSESPEFESAESWFCPDQGRLLSKNGSDRDACAVSFSCGSFAGFHDHSDRGSFTWFAERQWLIIDSGADNRREEGSAAQSIAHNTILIDGRGQALSGNGHGVNGQIVDFQTCPVWDYIAGDIAEAYLKDGYNPVAFAVRHFLFVKNPFSYVLIWDEFQKPDRLDHQWEFLVHTPVTLPLFQARQHDWYATPAKPNSTGLSIRFINPAGVTYNRAEFQAGASVHSLHRFGIRSVEPNFVTLLQFTKTEQLGMVTAECKLNSSGCSLTLRSKDEDFLDNIFFPSLRPTSRSGSESFEFARASL